MAGVDMWGGGVYTMPRTAMEDSHLTGTRVSGDLYNIGSYRSGIPESMTPTIFLGLLQRMRYIAGLALNVFLVLRRVC
jgi:hypothetical protein